MTKQVVGIDVGKAKLDIGVNGEKRVREWANDDSGRTEVRKWIAQREPDLVVVEASGGYEAAIVSELVEAGQAVALVPGQPGGLRGPTSHTCCPIYGPVEFLRPGRGHKMCGRRFPWGCAEKFGYVLS